MKKLYILIANGGDGSYYPKYVMDKKVIDRLQKAADNETMDYEFGVGMDGDGFHYATLNLPDECTPKSLGIKLMDTDDVDYYCKDKE